LFRALIGFWEEKSAGGHKVEFSYIYLNHFILSSVQESIYLCKASAHIRLRARKKFASKRSNKKEKWNIPPIFLHKTSTFAWWLQDNLWFGLLSWKCNTYSTYHKHFN